MKATNPTAPAVNETPDLSRVVEEALDAFWDIVSDHFPLAESGDLSLVSTEALDAAARKASEEWVKCNALPEA